IGVVLFFGQGANSTGLFVGNFSVEIRASEQLTGGSTENQGDRTLNGNQPSNGVGSITLSPSVDFEINPPVIQVTLIQEQSKRASFNISNIGNKSLTFDVKLKNLTKFIVLNQSNFTFRPGEEKELKLDLFAVNGVVPGIYTGEVVVTGGSIEKSANVVIQVNEKAPLFDTQVKVLQVQKQIFPNGDLAVSVTLKNMALNESFFPQIDLQLLVMDLSKKTLFYSSKETLVVEDELALKRQLHVPISLSPGRYLVVARVEYLGNVIDSYDLFEVVTPHGLLTIEQITNSPFGRYLPFALLGLVIGLIFLYRPKSS
ncbi:MAG: hypothetical protein Q8R15_00665, partial [Candidatus Micrarchaeota archaeon]|nr:hypothetical protein [Candidatus Micrarchaeota archaeon]